MRVISGKAKGTKLFTLEDLSTRPTLDRVKESIFNIIQNEINDKVILDLFSGSGAIGIEFLSRGAKKALLCDNSKQAIQIINKNLEKTHFKEQAIIYNTEYTKCLEQIKTSHQKIDIAYIDPPYDTDFASNSANMLAEFKLVKEDSIIIIETDNVPRVEEKIDKQKIEIYDKRKYGRASILFLKTLAK